MSETERIGAARPAPARTVLPTRPAEHAAASPVLLAQAGGIEPRGSGERRVDLTTSPTLFPSPSPEQTPAGFIEQSKTEKEKAYKFAFVNDVPITEAWHAHGSAGAAVGGYLRFGERASGVRELSEMEQSKLFEQLAIYWLTSGNLGAESSISQLIEYTDRTVRVYNRGNQPNLRYEIPYDSLYTLHPVKHASPFWLTKITYILLSRLQKGVELAANLETLKKFFQEIVGRLPESARPTINFAQTDLKILKHELATVLLDYYKSTTEPPVDHLLLGELELFLSDTAELKTDKLFHLNAAKSHLAFVANPNPANQRALQTQIVERIKYRKGGYDPLTKDPEMIQQEVSRSQGNALRLLAAIKIKEIDFSPTKKATLLVETIGLLLKAQEQLTGLERLAVRKMLGEALLELAGEEADKMPEIVRLFNEKGITIFREVGLTETTKSTKLLDAVIGWTEKIRDEIIAWDQAYLEKTRKSPEERPLWLIEIADLGDYATKSAIIRGKDLDSDIIEKYRLALDTLTDPDKLMKKGIELATCYLQLKGKNVTDIPARELVNRFFSKALRLISDPTGREALTIKFWQAKLATADAEKNLAVLVQARGILDEVIASGKLADVDAFEAQKVLAENMIRQGLIIRETRSGDYKIFILQALELLNSLLGKTFSDEEKVKFSYSIASATVWQAKALYILDPNQHAATAVELLRQAIESNKLKGKEKSSAIQALGEIMIFQANFSEAERLLQDAVSVDSQNHYAQASLADVLVWTDRYDEALFLYRKLLEIADLDSSLMIRAELGQLEAICRREDDYTLLATDKQSQELLVRAFKSRESFLIKRAIDFIIEAHEANPEWQASTIQIVNYLLGLEGDGQLAKIVDLPTPYTQLIRTYVDPRDLFTPNERGILVVKAAKSYLAQIDPDKQWVGLAAETLERDELAEGIIRPNTVAAQQLLLAKGALALKQDADHQTALETAATVMGQDPPAWIYGQAFLLKLEALQAQKDYDAIIAAVETPPAQLSPRANLQAKLYLVEAYMQLKRFDDAHSVARGVAEDRKASRFITAQALYKMAEIDRYGLDALRRAKQEYDEALVAAGEHKTLVAQIKFGQLKLLEASGQRQLVRDAYPALAAIKDDLPLVQQQELRSTGASLTDPIVTASEQGIVLADATEYREEINVNVPILNMGSYGQLYATGRILHDRAAGVDLTTPLVGVGVRDLTLDGGDLGPLVLSGELAMGTGTLVAKHEPGRTTHFLQQPDLTLKGGLWNQYFSADGSLDAQFYAGRDAAIQSGYVGLMHNFAWTDLPFLRDLSLGMDYSYSRFMYANQERERQSLALAARLKWDVLGSFDGSREFSKLFYLTAKARWTPGWIFNEYLPAAELMNDNPLSTVRHHGTASPHADWRRGMVGVGAIFDFGVLGLPLTLDASYNYYNTFAYQSQGREHNTTIHDWRVSLGLDLSEPFQTLIDWLNK